MSETLPATQEDRALAPADHNPFQRMVTHHGGMNAGAVEIESQRAIAEAQGQLTLAKRFPRSVSAAIVEFLEACNSPDFAATAFYTVPNRGSGPSIRFAEEAARCYGNFVYGHRELSRSEGKSEIEVYAWDMEKNNRSTRQITVMHVRDKQGGATKLTDQGDIDNRIANVASKQMRGRILALMPKHLVAAGVAAAKRTLAGNGEKPLRDRVIAMSQAFGRFGVTNVMLVAHLGHSVDDTTIDELADLTGIYNAIKEGAKASDYFKPADSAGGETGGTAPAAAAIAAQARKGAEVSAEKPVATEKPKAVATSTTKGSASGAASKETKTDSKQAAAAAPKPSQEDAGDDAQGQSPNNQSGEPEDVF